MQRPLLINLGLFVIAGVLTALILWEPGLESSPATPPLTALKAEAVQTLQLMRPDKAPLKFVRNLQGGWQMETPFALPANAFHIEIALNLLSERNYQPVTGVLDLAEAQLEPPLLTLQFNDMQIALGDLSPLGDGRRYLRVEGENYLTVDSVMPFINNDATSFLDLFLVPQTTSITELQLPNYHLVKEAGSWQLSEPLPVDAQVDTRPDALNTLVENWQRAQALSVRGYSQAHAAEGTAQITLANGAVYTFAILETDPDLMLALPDQGVSYHLAPRQVDKLLSLPALSRESTE